MDADALLTEIFTQLCDGVAQAKDGFHQFAFCSTDDTGAPDARTVVLRGLRDDERLLWFHTDRRSPKLREVQNSPSVCCLFYDAARRRQLRIYGVASVHVGGALMEQAWKKSPPRSRRCYLAEQGSSSVLESDSAMPEPVRARNPSNEESNAGKVNFAVIAVTFDRIDVVDLHYDGHERCMLGCATGTPITMTRLVP